MVAEQKGDIRLRVTIGPILKTLHMTHKTCQDKLTKRYFELF